MKMKDINLEYEENPEISREDIKKLIGWVEEQPHLPQIYENEAILFYHACLFSIEYAKQTVDLHFTLKSHCPEFFSGWNLQNDNIQKIMKTVALFPLNNCTPKGYRVCWGKLSDFDATNFNFNDSLKLYCMLFQMQLLHTGCCPGHILVIDLKGVTLGHITRLGPLTVKKLLYYLQEAAPIRIQGFHFVNIVPHTDKIIALMKPFMKKELFDVLYLHPTMEGLHAFVPKEITPKDYGGNDDTIENLKKNYYKTAVENKDFFIEEEQRGAEERLRPGKPKNPSTLFGIEGNFKKLDID